MSQQYNGDLQEEHFCQSKSKMNMDSRKISELIKQNELTFCTSLQDMKRDESLEMMMLEMQDNDLRLKR